MLSPESEGHIVLWFFTQFLSTFLHQVDRPVLLKLHFTVRETGKAILDFTEHFASFFRKKSLIQRVTNSDTDMTADCPQRGAAPGAAAAGEAEPRQHKPATTDARVWFCCQHTEQ